MKEPAYECQMITSKCHQQQYDSPIKVVRDMESNFDDFHGPILRVKLDHGRAKKYLPAREYWNSRQCTDVPRLKRALGPAKTDLNNRRIPSICWGGRYFLDQLVKQILANNSRAIAVLFPG